MESVHHNSPSDAHRQLSTAGPHAARWLARSSSSLRLCSLKAFDCQLFTSGIHMYPFSSAPGTCTHVYYYYYYYYYYNYYDYYTTTTTTIRLLRLPRLLPLRQETGVLLLFCRALIRPQGGKWI